MAPAEGPSTPGSRPTTNAASRLTTALNVSGNSASWADAPRTAGVPGTSSGRLSTGNRTANYDNMPLSVLAVELIKKMRIKFGEAACNVRGQEIITQEVMGLMTRNTKLQEGDLTALQERIRNRLTGEPASQNTLARQKRAQVERDEWGRVYQYQTEKGNVEDHIKLKAQQEAERRLKESLQLQVKEHEMQRKVDQEQEQLYFQAEQTQLKQWEQQEAQRRQREKETAETIKEDRQLQLVDKTQRQQLALAKRAEEEQIMARRIAYDTRREFEKEEATRVQAKTLYRESMMLNLTRQKQRDDEKQKQAQEDLKYKQLWEEKLNKQEQDRLTQRDKVLAIQKKMLDQARSLPEERNRWVDQSVIDRQYRELEEAKAAEEARRSEKVRSGNETMKGKLAEQVREKERQRQLQRQEEEEKARVLLAKVAAEEAAEKERQRQALERKLRFRRDLESQMRENAARRGEAPMSHVEKLINTQLLVEVEQFEQTGKISLPPVK